MSLDPLSILTLDSEINGTRRTIIVAMRGGALVGHLHLTDCRHPTPTLYDVFVNPDYRFQGIGRALIDKAAEIARERGCRTLTLTFLKDETGPIPFYLHIGFQYGIKYANETEVLIRPLNKATEPS